MQLIIKYLFILLSLCMSCYQSSAQNLVKNDMPVEYSNKKVSALIITLSRKDEVNIKSSAERVLIRFMNLLNFIATGIDIEVPDLEKVITESYTRSENRIFYDSSSLIKDDLGIVPGNKSSKEKFVSRYLRDFDLLYKKNTDQSVEFSNIKYSNIRNGEYLHIKVSFDCLLQNKSAITNKSYPETKRIAEFKLEKINNKWKSWIMSVQFSDSVNSISPSKNDVTIVEDADKSAPENAESKSPDVRFNDYVKEALFAENSKKFNEAIGYYKLALAVKPDQGGVVNVRIQQLTIRKNNLLQLEDRYAAGQFKDAVTGYDLAIKEDPRWSDYYFGRGKCYERMKDYKLALKDYNKAIDYDAANPAVYKARAALQEVLGNYPNAINDYTAYANMDKADAYVLHKIAFLYILSDNLNKALEAIDRAISVNNKISSLHHLKGELQLKLKSPGKAVLSFSAAIKLDSTKADNFFFRGLCNLELNKIEEAGRDFYEAQKLVLDTVSIDRIRQIGQDFYKSGQAFLDSGQIDSAISKFNAAIYISPGKDLYQFKLGECYIRSGRYETAIECYSRAIRLNAFAYEAYRQRGLSYLRISQFKTAIADFNKSLQISPRQYQMYKFIGDAYFNLADYNNAGNYYDTVITKFNKALYENLSLETLYTLAGKAYFNAGNPFKAIQNFDNAIKINDNNASSYFNRGWAYFNFNELNKAELDLKKAILMDDKNATWNFKLAEIYIKTGAFDLAIGQFNHSIVSDSSIKDLKTVQASSLISHLKYADVETGYSLLRVNQVQSAILTLDIALTKDPSDVIAFYFKSVALLRNGKPGDAMACLEKALTLAPGKITLTTVLADFKDLIENETFKALLKKYQL